jgi:phage terminase large subunit
MQLNIKIPEKLLPFMVDDPDIMYKVAYGGRGGAKSWFFAQYIVLKTFENSDEIVLCCRETRNSIKDSVQSVIVETIKYLKLQEYYIITRDEIRSHAGSRIIFKGLKHDSASIKSSERITRCWVEEAEKVSEQSWVDLLPTVMRQDKCEILISFNPRDEKNPTYQRFVVNAPKESIVIKINYYDNPFFGEKLDKLRLQDKEFRPNSYAHIWLGECAKLSNAIIFKDKFIVEEFEIESQYGVEYFKGDGFKYKHGMDFGFSADPFAMTECFVRDGNLYILSEIYAYKLETDDIIPLIKEKLPKALNNKIFADSARPETISQLQQVRTHRDGYLLEALDIEAAIKGKGSVKEGIEYLRNFKQIIIHPRCVNTIYEFENYSYKQDKQTDEIYTEIEDKHNHIIDAIRYAFNLEIQALHNSGLQFTAEDMAYFSQPQDY